uniref:Very-long-chain 3-oxoacyl-CoA synthase n=1 Tax=Heterorhabditis bacteriophora TaxID=37862 RepID=A0A1I7W7X7_HETBA
MFSNHYDRRIVLPSLFAVIIYFAIRALKINTPRIVAKFITTIQLIQFVIINEILVCLIRYKICL